VSVYATIINETNDPLIDSNRQIYHQMIQKIKKWRSYGEYINYFQQPNIFYNHQLYIYAAQRSQQYIPLRYLQGHKTWVDSTQLEYTMIMMSIISICWAIGMWKTKSQEGQCREHTTECSESKAYFAFNIHKIIYCSILVSLVLLAKNLFGIYRYKFSIHC
jgi:hypothetical protein